MSAFWPLILLSLLDFVVPVLSCSQIYYFGQYNVITTNRNNVQNYKNKTQRCNKSELAFKPAIPTFLGHLEATETCCEHN